jgi:hypothetical protein
MFSPAQDLIADGSVTATSSRDRQSAPECKRVLAVRRPGELRSSGGCDPLGRDDSRSPLTGIGQGPCDHRTYCRRNVPQRLLVKSWPSESRTVGSPPPGMSFSMMSDPFVPDRVISQ